MLCTAGGSRDSRRPGCSRGEGSRGRSWPCWTSRAKGRAWFSRTVGECEFLGKLAKFSGLSKGSDIHARSCFLGFVWQVWLSSRLNTADIFSIKMSLGKELAVPFQLKASYFHQGGRTRAEKGRETEILEGRVRRFTHTDCSHTGCRAGMQGSFVCNYSKALLVATLLLVQPWKLLTMRIWKDANLEQCFY